MRVRYIRNATRLGFQGNFAQLFTLGSGDYVKFLNDDDSLAPESVTRMVAAFAKLGSRIALATSRRLLVDEAAEVADTPATVPLAHRDCIFNGQMLGDDLLLAIAERCIAERFYLPRDCRTLGFLQATGDYASALRHGGNLLREWLARPGISPAARRIFEDAQRESSAG